MMVTLFFGGWTLSIAGYGLTTATLQAMGIWGGILGAVIFLAKVMMFMLVYVWFRATFPRFRFDQLMELGWKWMIPLALANIFVTGIVVLAVPNEAGEVVLSVAGAIIIALTLFLLFRPKAKVVAHAG